jgi:hypothetical protein
LTDVSALAEQLRLLFKSDLPDPHLVLEGGQPKIAAAPDDTGGVLDIASRDDLLVQLGGQAPDAAQLAELASRLQATVDTLGA